LPATDAADLHNDALLLNDAVRAAGALAMTYFGKAPKAWNKKGDTPVSEADIAVNDLLEARLKGARPAYGWLSEETDDKPDARSQSRVWVVDPIDGTRAFLKGRPHFTVSVALVENGAPLIAAVYNPATGEFFEAQHGTGTKLNGNAVSVTNREAIEGCRMVAYAPMFKHPAWQEPWPEMEIVERNSVAYRIALVASGQADAVLALNGKSDWDIAAAHLLIEEAGGCISAHDGTPLVYNRASTRHPSLVAAGPALFDALRRKLAPVKLPG